MVVNRKSQDKRKDIREESGWIDFRRRFIGPSAREHLIKGHRDHAWSDPRSVSKEMEIGIS